MISKCRLLSIPHNRCLDHLWILQYLVQLILWGNVLNQRQQIFILKIRIDHILHATINGCHSIELAFAHALFFHVDKLIFNSAFLEEALCFLCIIALFCAEDLDVHFYFSSQNYMLISPLAKIHIFILQYSIKNTRLNANTARDILIHSYIDVHHYQKGGFTNEHTNIQKSNAVL